MDGIFFTSLRAVAKAYAGDDGEVVSAVPNPNARIIDASGNLQDENWHQVPIDEWREILNAAELRGIELVANYDLDIDHPLMWEAVFDSWDGLVINPGFITILKKLGFDGVKTYEPPVGFCGDIFKRFGEEAFQSALQLEKQIYGNIPVIIFFNRDAYHTHSEIIQQALSEGRNVPREVLEEYKGESWADKALIAGRSEETCPKNGY